MCDYSLMGLPNRLAVEQENLVVHKFSTGSHGLAAPQAPVAGLWEFVKNIFRPPVIVAVCVPPGARLFLQDIPTGLQKWLSVCSEEEVTFTQVTAEVNNHRDAVCFRTGGKVLLQDLRVGQRVRVLDLSGAGETEVPTMQHLQQRISA